MKNQTLILTGTAIVTAALTSTVAAITYFHSQPTAPQNRKTEQPVASSSQPATPTSTLNPSTPEATPSVPPPDTNFPHWRIQLTDETQQSPDFAKFLDRVKQAVRDRDAQFIRSIVTPKTKFTFGEHRSIDYLNPENPNSPFWSQLEKSLVLGCTNEQIFFSCPTTFRQFDAATKNAPNSQKDIAYESSIIVVGENVNVRSQPSTTAPTIAALTNEIVRFDAETFSKASVKDRSETLNLSNLDGWTPVILPNDKHGYVSNRYAYSPLGYRVLFAKEEEKWVIQAFLSGD
jgi:hypothetical protein